MAAKAQWTSLSSAAKVVVPPLVVVAVVAVVVESAPLATRPTSRWGSISFRGSFGSWGIVQAAGGSSRGAVGAGSSVGRSGGFFGGTVGARSGGSVGISGSCFFFRSTVTGRRLVFVFLLRGTVRALSWGSVRALSWGSVASGRRGRLFRGAIRALSRGSWSRS